MSVLWIEGFDSFGVTLDAAADSLEYKYTSSQKTTDMSVVAGRFAQYAMRIKGGGGQTGYVTTPNLGNIGTIVTGFGFKPQVLMDTRMVVLREGDDSTEGVNVRQRADGKIDVYRGNTLLATSGDVVLTANTWHHIELKVTVSDTGSYEVRVNGVVAVSGSGDTRAGSNDYCNRVRLQ
jgi:hypothetical protein